MSKKHLEPSFALYSCCTYHKGLVHSQAVIPRTIQ